MDRRTLFKLPVLAAGALAVAKVLGPEPSFLELVRRKMPDYKVDQMSVYDADPRKYTGEMLLASRTINGKTWVVGVFIYPAMERARWDKDQIAQHIADSMRASFTEVRHG